jgi:hypothetical protein
MKRSQARVVAGVVGGVALLWLVVFTLEKVSEQPAVSAWLAESAKSFAEAAGVHSLASTWFFVSNSKPSVTRINEYKNMHGTDFSSVANEIASCILNRKLEFES